MSEPTRFGRYVVIRREDGTEQELGRGPFGITYKAWDAESKQDVALTLIDPSLLVSEKERDRFLEKAEAIAELHHPNIATLLYVGQATDDHRFYVTELCEGPNLEQALKAEGPVPVRDALHVVLQAAQALTLAEERHLMHGDIKPTSLIITSSAGGDTVVKLIDFGLAQGFGEGAQTLGALGSAGTAYFASPERLAEKDDLDIRSDIYSLGACLWYMLTGHPPFEGPVALAMSRTLFEEVSWDKVATQPEPVISLLKSMLAKKPDARVASPGLLCREIEDYLKATEPPPARLAQAELPLDAVKEEPVEPLAVRFQPVEEIGHDGISKLFRAVHHANQGASVGFRLIDLSVTTVPATWRELQAQIRLAHNHPHPNFVNVITAETTDEGLAIIQDYVQGFSIFELLKTRGRLTSPEALQFLQQLALATDHAVSQGVKGFSLAKKHVFVHFPGGAGEKTFAQIITMPLREWPPHEIKADVISLGDPDSTVTGTGPDPATKEIGALACLACDLLGGQGGRTFSPCPRLTETGNSVLQSASTEAGVYPSAQAFVEALREAVGRITPASERRGQRPVPPSPMSIPKTVPSSRKPRLPQPALTPDKPVAEPLSQSRPVPSRKLGLTQWLIIAALLAIAVADGAGYYYFVYLPREERQAAEDADQQRAANEQQLSAEETAKAEAASEATVQLPTPPPAEATPPPAPSPASPPAPTEPATSNAPSPTQTSTPTPPPPAPTPALAPTPDTVATVATDNPEAAAYRVKATAGDVEAARQLGLLYYSGTGVPKDYGEALKWLQMAADHDDPVAQTRLGTMYFNGWGVTKDYSQALHWHQKAADQGNSEGLNHLGAMYAAGWGVPQDYGQALKLIKKSADQGDAEGEMSLGSLYKNGLGVTKDYAQAFSWFKKAAAQGNAAAQSEMGIMYGKGLGVTKDYSEAFVCFQKAADQGDSGAQVNIGDMFRNGLGLPQDYGQAVGWYQKAADQGDPVGQTDLGDMYENGWGVTKDYAQAKTWYQKAADQGNAVAQNNLGFMYQNGWSVPQDYAQAMTWYQKAADQGNPAAQNNIGCLYANGSGVKQDYNQAMTWLQKSAAQGDGQAMHLIGELYANGWSVAKDDKEALKWYKKAVAAGDSTATDDILLLKKTSDLLTPSP